jgi:hypothetical protein
MNKILTYFQDFNDHCKSEENAVAAINFLDQNHPQWRSEVKDRSKWKAVFEFDIHIIHDNCLADFASKLFEIIGGDEAPDYVWNNTRCNEYYRFAALSLLLKHNEEKYLPAYREALQAGSFDFKGDFDIILHFFDFPSGYDVAFELCRSSAREDYFPKNQALDMLASSAKEQWFTYPADIQDYIIRKRYYDLACGCTLNFWKQLSENQKLMMVYNIILFEYKNVHDILNLHQWLHTKSTAHLSFWGYAADTYRDFCKEHQQDTPRNTAFILRSFMVPSVDYETQQYKPSKLMLQMMSLTDSAHEEHLHTLLTEAVEELSGNQQ